jgi:CRP/FNR family transcriptional regulator, cyclic AMP receptor protein
VAAAFQQRTFDAGDTIAEERTTGATLFVIDRGEATVSVGGRDVRSLGPGDSFGEVGLVDRERLRSATVRAKTELLAHVLSAWDFEPILDSYPTVARRLLHALAARLREAEMRAADRPPP